MVKKRTGKLYKHTRLPQRTSHHVPEPLKISGRSDKHLTTNVRDETDPEKIPRPGVRREARMSSTSETDDRLNNWRVPNTASTTKRVMVDTCAPHCSRGACFHNRLRHDSTAQKALGSRSLKNSSVSLPVDWTMASQSVRGTRNKRTLHNTESEHAVPERDLCSFVQSFQRLGCRKSSVIVYVLTTMKLSPRLPAPLRDPSRVPRLRTGYQESSLPRPSRAEPTLSNILPTDVRDPREGKSRGLWMR